MPSKVRILHLPHDDDCPAHSVRGRRRSRARSRGPVVTETVGSRVGSSRAWAVWGAGLSVYLLAVFNRSSLGVAGLLAAERFEIEATALALFTVLQLVVDVGQSGRVHTRFHSVSCPRERAKSFVNSSVLYSPLEWGRGSFKEDSAGTTAMS